VSFLTDDEVAEKPDAEEKMETDGEKSADESNKSNSEKGLHSKQIKIENFD
jgi:hypothetical protein